MDSPRASPRGRRSVAPPFGGTPAISVTAAATSSVRSVPEGPPPPASVRKLTELKARPLRDLEGGGDGARRSVDARAAAAPGPVAGEGPWAADRVRELLNRTAARPEAQEEAEALVRERERMAAENRRLRRLAEAEGKGRLGPLRPRADIGPRPPFDAQATLAELRALNGEIQTEVQQLQATVEAQMEVEKLTLVRTYRAKMHDLKRRLAEEKALNYTGAQEWIERNKVLQQELDAATGELRQLRARNRQMAAENRDLHAAFKRQEQARAAMVERITAVKSENQRLEKHIGTLEERAQAAAAADASGDLLSLGSLVVAVDSASDPYMASAAGRQEAVLITNRLKVALEQDRAALQAARSAHLGVLGKRTELEVFLRRCLEDVRREIARASQDLAHRPVSQSSARDTDFSLAVYTAQDPRRALEILQSKERLLVLLFEKTFPHRKEAAAPAPAPVGVAVAPSGTGALEEDQLWRKWKALVDPKAPKSPEF